MVTAMTTKTDPALLSAEELLALYARRALSPARVATATTAAATHATTAVASAAHPSRLRASVPSRPSQAP